MRFVIITGLSGAGKSTAVRCLEDWGYYCIDNLPPSFLRTFGEMLIGSQGKFERVAVVCDIRSGEMFGEMLGSLNELDACGYDYEILFLDASDESLIKRYKETRRSHPLGGSLTEAISAERKLLNEVKMRSNNVIDTTLSTLKQLRMELSGIFESDPGHSGINVHVMSFGFKYGIPLDADLVFDVRFLPNPFYIDALKHHSGLESCVSEYVMSFKQSVQFEEKLIDMLEFLMPHYIEEGKGQLVIAIGCTGGRHRSVTLAEKLYKHLKESHNAIVTHRDIKK